MKHSLIKLVDAILRQMEEHPESIQTEKGIRSWLAQQGFAKRDIDAAISLIKPRMSRPSPVVIGGRHFSIRALTDDEHAKLSPEARDALARLESYGLIDVHERELVLEQCLRIDGSVSMDDLDYLLSWAVGSTRDYETQRTLFSVFEGQGDTIN